MDLHKEKLYLGNNNNQKMYQFNSIGLTGYPQWSYGNRGR